MLAWNLTGTDHHAQDWLHTDLRGEQQSSSRGNLMTAFSMGKATRKTANIPELLDKT